LIICISAKYICIETQEKQLSNSKSSTENTGKKQAEKVTGSTRVETALKKLSHDLEERVKELSCLYSISNILNDSNLSTEEALKKILNVIIPSYQYPEITAARLTLPGREYKTANYKNSKWKQVAPILIKRKPAGELEVVYLKKRPDIYEGPFLKEERHLINSITQLLIQFLLRKRTEHELTESGEQLKNFAAHLQTIREEERIFISRELHDNLGQKLTAMRIDLFNIITEVNEKNDSGSLDIIIKQSNDLSTIIDSTIQTVRNIARELRPSILDDLGLLAALEWHSKEFEKRTGIVCRIITNLGNIEVEKEHSIGVYRIVQESLTNVARHSRATEVNIKIFKKDDSTYIEVKDNGCGIDNNKIFSTKSLGLLGMRERALIFGGELSVKGDKTKGTRILLKIPINKKIR